MKLSAITPAIASAIERPIHRGVYRPLGGGRRKSITRRLADIFAATAGIWYDPQDLTTMYQDAAGTLPVYRPGSGLVDPPVGLLMDKSGGGYHASQSTTTARPTLSGRYNLLTNTGFSEGTLGDVPTGWFERGSVTGRKIEDSTTSSGFAARVISTGSDGVGSSSDLRQPVSGLVAGTNYEVSLLCKFNTENSPGLKVAFLTSSRTLPNPGVGGYVRYTLPLGTATSSIQSFFLGGSNGLSVDVADINYIAFNDGVNLPAYQEVTNATTYDTAGFPLYLKRDKVDDVLTCVAPAITGYQGMGSTGGAVLGPVIIPAGTYTPLSESAITGIPEITRYVAIDGTLTASEQAVVERYLSVPSSGVFADEPVFSFGLTSVASFSFNLRTKANTAPVLIDWGDGTQSTHAGTTDQTASHTYAVSGTYAVKVYGADESVLTRFSTSAAGMSGDLVMTSGMTTFYCGGSNTLTGTLSLPSGMTTFHCAGSNTLSGYTQSAKASNQQRFYLAGLNTMSSTDVDNILIDYAAAGGTWAGDKVVTIQGNAANRTSVSDAAYASLASKLTTLSVD